MYIPPASDIYNALVLVVSTKYRSLGAFVKHHGLGYSHTHAIFKKRRNIECGEYGLISALAKALCRDGAVFVQHGVVYRGDVYLTGAELPIPGKEQAPLA